MRCTREQCGDHRQPRQALILGPRTLGRAGPLKATKAIPTPCWRGGRAREPTQATAPVSAQQHQRSLKLPLIPCYLSILHIPSLLLIDMLVEALNTLFTCNCPGPELKSDLSHHLSDHTLQHPRLVLRPKPLNTQSYTPYGLSLISMLYVQWWPSLTLSYRPLSNPSLMKHVHHLRPRPTPLLVPPFPFTWQTGPWGRHGRTRPCTWCAPCTCSQYSERMSSHRYRREAALQGRLLDLPPIPPPIHTS